jgi:hypothetical protein
MTARQLAMQRNRNQGQHQGSLSIGAAVIISQDSLPAILETESISHLDSNNDQDSGGMYETEGFQMTLIKLCSTSSRK